MKSGLEGRNNLSTGPRGVAASSCLNEVRPRRPEQSRGSDVRTMLANLVSMKSGLEGRNNQVRQRMVPIHGELVSMKSGLEDRNNNWGLS